MLTGLGLWNDAKMRAIQDYHNNRNLPRSINPECFFFFIFIAICDISHIALFQVIFHGQVKKNQVVPSQVEPFVKPVTGNYKDKSKVLVLVK